MRFIALMVNRSTFFALIVKLAADSCVVPKRFIPAIPAAAFELEGVASGPPNQPGPFGNKDWIHGFYVTESHTKFL